MTRSKKNSTARVCNVSNIATAVRPALTALYLGTVSGVILIPGGEGGGV